MIGISLPPAQLDCVGDILPAVYDLGVRQIELMYVESALDRLAHSIDFLHTAGFTVMLHVGASLTEDLLHRLSLAVKGAKQESFLLTLPTDCLKCPEELLSYMMAIREEMLPLLPAVEWHGEADLPDRLDACGLSGLGLCLSLDEIPRGADRSFLRDKRLKDRLVCVRIKDSGTLLDADMREILSSVSYGYFGTYNVSLPFVGENTNEDTSNAVICAVQNLYGALPLCGRLYDDIQLHFDERFRHALTVWDRPDRGTYFSLIHSTAFLFQTNGFRWAMDIAFRNTYRLSDLPHEAMTLLKDLELMVISHGHSDHFEERTVRALAQNATCWIIPDFLIDTALSWGLPQERIITARAGESIHVGPLTILPFDGHHFRPVTGKGVRSYGYFITAQGAPSLIFPGDTRDFSTAGLPPLPEADWCFANVWLGDKSGFLPEYGDILTEYAEYMLHFSRRNMLFAHLYECNRKLEDMWRRTHARLIGETMRAVCPEIRTYIPASGDVIRLV